MGHLKKINLKELGFKLIIVAAIYRQLERMLAKLTIHNWLPQLSHEGPSSLLHPLEFWSPPWAMLVLIIGIVAGILALRPGRLRIVGLSLSFLHIIFFSDGAGLISKSTIFLQPALLVLLLNEFFETYLKKPFPVRTWFILLFACMYGFNGITKTGVEWKNGLAAGLFLTSNTYSLGLSEAPQGLIWKLLTWFTMYWEICGFLLLIPFKKFAHYFRMSYAFIAIIFHFSLFFISIFHVFGLAIIGAWFIVLGELDKSYPPLLKQKMILTLTLLWSALLIGPNLAIFTPKLLTPRPLAITLIKMRLFTFWTLFAPSPEYGIMKGKIIFPNGHIEEVTKGNAKLGFLLESVRRDYFYRPLKESFCREPGTYHIEWYADRFGYTKKDFICPED